MTLVYGQKFVPKKKYSLKKRSSLQICLGFHGMDYFTNNICLTNFVISSRTPCALITDPILGNSDFGDVIILLNLR